MLCLLIAASLAVSVSARGYADVARPDGVNVARYKTATASAAGQDPYKAIDGSGAQTFGTNGKCYQATTQANGYVRIDMGASYMVHALEMWTVDKTTTARTQGDRNYQMRIGDNAYSVEGNPVCCDFGNPYVPRHDACYCDRPLCGRYVTIQRTYNNNYPWHLCELLVFSLDHRNPCTNATDYLPTTTTTTTTPKPTPKPTTPKPTTPKPTPKPTTPAPTEESVNVCTMKATVGNCANPSSTRYFYKIANGKCMEFTGCDNVKAGGSNSFASKDACNDACEGFTIPPECLLDPDVGNCGGQTIKYAYDRDLGKCKKLKYTGCGGNDNRFDYKADCASYCKGKRS